MTGRFRKSAVVIPVTTDAGGIRVLAGRRSAASRFLGGFVAFPGGVHEPDDGDLARDGEDACLRRTGARELLEETGVRVATDALRGAGRRISPPFTPVRFDSLIYTVDIPGPPPAPRGSGELEGLAWERPADLVRRWRELEIRVAPPVLPMLFALAEAPAGTDGAELARRVEQANTFPEDEGPRIEFVPDVLMVPQRTPTLLPATTTNCYLVGSRGMLVIDPGAEDPSERTRLRGQIARRKREGAEPIAVVLTHHHGDHVAGALPLAREMGLPVWAHAETLTRWAGAGEAERGAGVRALRDGETLDLSGGERLRVLHTPGHAPGHVALLEETHGSLFAGDLVSGISTILIDPAPGSLDRYLASLGRLLEYPMRTVFPGHGPPGIDPLRMLRGVLEHRADRERRITEAIEAGVSDLPGIVRRAYADTPRADPALAARQTEAHLARLVDRGRIRPSAAGWEPVHDEPQENPNPEPGTP